VDTVIVGNALYLNSASVRGAGMYFAATAEVPSIVWGTNTIWDNSILPTWSAPSGVGLYCPPTGLPVLPTSGRSTILHSHGEGGSGQDDWLVEDSPGYLFEELTYTFTPRCSSPFGFSPHDLFDTVSDDETVPVIEELPGLVRRYCRQLAPSVSIDGGNDTAFLAALQNPRLAIDFEGEPRVNPLTNLLDSGADEFYDTIEFLRMDANEDGILNIADPVTILGRLFSGFVIPVLSCRDTDDVNDDGQVNIADAVYALAALFTPGSPLPPPPHPGCGTDPTPDSLPCVAYPHCP